MIARARSALVRNTPGRSRRDIAAHYDLGNELFELMLDETIITETPPLYSCYGHIGEQVRVPISGNRAKRIDELGRAQEYSLRYAVVFALRKADGTEVVPRVKKRIS